MQQLFCFVPVSSSDAVVRFARLRFFFLVFLPSFSSFFLPSFSPLWDRLTMPAVTVMSLLSGTKPKAGFVLRLTPSRQPKVRVGVFL
jgi:hypothetical protein